MRNQNRAVAGLAIASLVAAAVVGLNGASAQADPSSASVIAVPTGDRAYARAAQVYGETDFGVVLREEVDPADYNGSPEQAVLVAADGSQSTLVGPTGGYPDITVFGDRIVGADISDFALTSVKSMVLPDGEWTTTTLPATGAKYLGISAAGIVLNVESGPAIEPWGSGDLVPISELPAGLVVNKVLAADAHGLVLNAESDGSTSAISGALYLDTDTDRIWPLVGAQASAFALSATDIFWQSGDSTISSVTRPTSDDGVGPVTTRSFSNPDAGRTVYDSQLYAAGDDAILFSDVSNGETQTTSIHADGTTTDLGNAIGSIAEDGGHLLAVVSTDPEDETIQRIDPGDGSSVTLLHLLPVPAQASAVAIDGDTLETSGNAGVVRRDLDFGSGTASSGTTLDSAGNKLFAHDGDVYWTNSSGYRQQSSQDGTERAVTAPLASTDLDAVGTNWWFVSADRQSGNADLINVASGSVQKASFDSAMFDDVAYTPAGDVAGLLGGGVVLRDLDTGQQQYLPVAGCDQAGGVQAAAAWLLVDCANGDYVVDQSGDTPEWKVSGIPAGTLMLGNGFLVSEANSGTIEWTSLSGPDADWQTIGATSLPIDDPTSVVSVSTGSIPSMAWIDQTGQVQAALLPNIPTRGLASHPTGQPTAVPATPTLTSTSGEGTLTLNWSAADPLDQVVDFVIGGPGSHTVTVPASTTHYTFTGLEDGYEKNYTVTAQNAVGQSSAAKITAAAWNPNPQTPSDVTAEFDQDASSLQVAWSSTSAIGVSPLTGYTVSIPGATPVSVSPGALDATIDGVRVATGTTVTVTALSENGSATAAGITTLKPGRDFTPPTTSLTKIMPVTLGTTLTATATGTDGRAMGTVDIRYNAATSGHALGSWIYPSSWQKLTNAHTVDKSGLTRGATYCLEMRARDAVGNESGWSTPSCTVVVADDRALSRTSTWRRVTGSSYLLRTATASSSTSGYAATSIRATTVWIVARTCSTCGDVGVKIDGHTTWVSLLTPTTREQVVIQVPTTSKLTGTMELVQRTKWKPVTIDGFAALDY